MGATSMHSGSKLLSTLVLMLTRQNDYIKLLTVQSDLSLMKVKILPVSVNIVLIRGDLSVSHGHHIQVTVTLLRSVLAPGGSTSRESTRMRSRQPSLPMHQRSLQWLH
jgi:hypothetical protein